MALPTSSMVASDGNLGIVPPSNGQTVVKVGVCSAGDQNVLTFPATKTALVATNTSGPTVDAAALAFDYPNRGAIGICRTAASNVGVAGAVTKTDPAGAAGTPIVIYGGAIIPGADLNGRVFVRAKDDGVTLTVVQGADGDSLLASVVGKAVTIRTAAAAGAITTTGTALAAYSLPGPVAALIELVKYGTGASLISALATTALDGKLTITPKVQSVKFKLLAPTGSSTALAAAISNTTEITLTPGTNSDSQATAAANTATLVKAAIDLVASALVTVTVGTGGSMSGAGASLAAAAFQDLVFGSTAALSISGDPLDAWGLRVKGTRSGAAGVGAFKVSLDGGDGYSDEIAYPSGGIYTIPGSGLTLTFTGNLAVNDLFSSTCTAPSWSNGDLATALDAVIASTSSYSIVHIVGPQDATSFATVSTKAASAEAVKKFLLFIVEAPGQSSNQTNAQWSASVISTFANSADKRIGICAGEAEIVSPLATPQAGRTMRRSIAYALAARAGSVPISEDMGRVASGPLLGVVSLYQADQSETLDAAGFSTAYSIQDYSGFFGQGRLKAPTGSDFVYWQDIRVLNEAMRLGYRGQTRYLNEGLRVRTSASGQYPAGSIDPADAQTVEAYLNGILRENLTKPGYATTAVATVDRTVNLLTTKTLKVKYDVAPLGTIKTINGTAGLKIPALAL